MQTYVTQYQNDPQFQQKADEIMGQVLARSATDRAFRDLLISSPAEALAQFTGTDASFFADVNVAFVENKGVSTIVLPDVATSAELSDAELEAVAGGSEPATIIAVATLAGAALAALAAGMTLN